MIKRSDIVIIDNPTYPYKIKNEYAGYVENDVCLVLDVYHYVPFNNAGTDLYKITLLKKRDVIVYDHIGLNFINEIKIL